jgi:hypothetical protein
VGEAAVEQADTTRATAATERRMVRFTVGSFRRGDVGLGFASGCFRAI